MRKCYKALLVAVALTLVSVAVVGAVDPGTGNVDVVVMNTDSAGAAHVIASYYNQAGPPPEKERAVDIPAKGFFELKSDESGLPSNWVGSMVVSSDRSVAALANVYWTGGDPSPGDQAAAGTYSGVTEGSSTVYLPSLYTSPLFSKFSVQNADTGAVTIHINLYDRNGVAYAGNPVNATIPQGAQKTYDMRTDFPGLASGWDGSAMITTDGGKKIAAVATTHWAGRSSACNGLAAGDRTLYAPTQYRVLKSGGDPSQAMDYLIYSAIVLQNLSGSATADVDLDYIPRDPANPTLHVDISIPPLSAKGLNTFNGGSLPASTFDPLGAWWDGIVKVTSDQDLVGIVNTNWRSITAAGTYGMVAEAEGNTTLYGPIQYRVSPGGNFTQWSAMIVQNVSGSPANVTLTYRNASGATVHTISKTINAGRAMGFNTNNGGDLDPSEFVPLGDNFVGTVEITSNQNVQAVGNLRWKGPFVGTTYNVIAP